jgi:exonuclease SbcD
MRIVHTSDWHLGHTLHDIGRAAEHRAFLHWLLGELERLQADALLVAGDLFDSANPPAEAQAELYGFLARARTRLPRLAIVLIGGNHDSAARLDAPQPLLEAFGVHVVGGLARAAAGGLDAARLVVPLKDRSGVEAVRLIALPFLRPADLPVIRDDGVDALIEGVRRVYAEAIALAERGRMPGQALVAMGHLYMAGGALSELSERKILGGNQHALPADIFPESLAYVALGHLHRAQAVGRPTIRYSGAPIPLSMAEIDVEQQISVVDIEQGHCAGLQSLPVPRVVPLWRVPASARPLPEVEAALRVLSSSAHLPEDLRPIVEVPVLLQQPEPALRARVEQALAGKGVRLARIAASYDGSGQALADALPQATLHELQPEQVLRRCWARDHADEPPSALLAAFHQLLDDEAQQA